MSLESNLIDNKTKQLGLPVEMCRSTKTQVNPSSALKRTKHHQSDPSNIPEILGSNYP